MEKRKYTHHQNRVVKFKLITICKEFGFSVKDWLAYCREYDITFKHKFLLK